MAPSLKSKLYNVKGQITRAIPYHHPPLALPLAAHLLCFQLVLIGNFQN